MTDQRTLCMIEINLGIFLERIDCLSTGFPTHNSIV